MAVIEILESVHTLYLAQKKPKGYRKTTGADGLDSVR